MKNRLFHYNHGSVRSLFLLIGLWGLLCIPGVQAAFVVSPRTAPVREGATRVVKIALSEEPSANVVGTIQRTSGDSDLQVVGPGTFTIQKAQWQTGVQIELKAEEDADTTSGPATFTVHETSANGNSDQMVQGFELENDNLIPVGGVLAGNTDWTDTTRNYVITSQVTVPATFTLHIGPGVVVQHQGGSFNSFVVNGKIQVDQDATLYMRTYAHWSEADRRDGIVLLGNAQGLFQRCRLLANEERDNWNPGRNEWGFAVRARQNSTLDMRGVLVECVSVSTNFRTGYGVRTEGCTTSLTTAGGIKNTFRGFRWGLYRSFDASPQVVDLCAFENCEMDEAIDGTIEANTTFNNQSTHTVGTIRVKKGIQATLAQGSAIYRDGYMRWIVDGGILTGSKASFYATTTSHWADNDRYHGIEAINKGKLNLDECSLYGTDTRGTGWFNELASLILLDSSSEAVLRGCKFETSAADGRRSGIGVNINRSKIVMEPFGGTQNQFKNLFAGIKQAMGSNSQSISRCLFDNCATSHYLGGTLETALALNNTGIRNFGTLTIKPSGTMTLNPGSELYRTYPDEFIVDGGTLNANEAQISVDTENHWDENYKRHGIYLRNGAHATFQKSNLHTYERRGVPHINEWVGFLRVDNKSFLTVSGSVFESKGATERGGYGVFIAGGTVTIQASNLTPTTFKGLRCGFVDHFGPGSLNAAPCQFINTDYQAALSGNIDKNTVVNSQNKHHLFGDVTVKSGNILTLPANCDVNVNSRWLTIEKNATCNVQGNHITADRHLKVGGTLNAGNVLFDFNTRSTWYEPDRFNGINCLDGSISTFDNCTIRGQETRSTGNDNDWSALIYAAPDASIDLTACFFAPPMNSAMPTRFAIRSWSQKALRIARCSFHEQYMAVRLDALPLQGYIHNSNMAGNYFAVMNVIPSMFDAQGNWWGSPTGPAHIQNPGGLGDPVSDNVDYGQSSLAPKGSQLTVLNPTGGQESNTLLVQDPVQKVELYGFRINPGQTTIASAAFRLYSLSGLEASQFTNFKLVKDDNGNQTAGPLEMTQAVDASRVVSGQNGIHVFFDSPFTTPADVAKGCILICDLAGVQANDSLSVDMPEYLIESAPGQTIVSQLAETRHRAGPAIWITDPATGPVPDNLTGAIRQNNVVLYAFNLVGTTQQTRALKFTLSEVRNLPRSVITSAALYRDTNADRQYDAGDERIGSPTEIVINSGSGHMGFAETLSMNQAYLLVANFRGLNDGAALTVQLFPNNVFLTAPGNVLGYCSPVNHMADPPYIIAQSDAWNPPANFGASTNQSNFVPLGIRIAPLGRTINSLKITLDSVVGIYPGELSNCRMVWDKNNNGVFDTGEELVGGPGTVLIDGNEGSIQFNTPFVVRGRYLLMADYITLVNGDEMTVSLKPEDVSVPESIRVTGSVQPIRYVVQAGTPDSRSPNMNWTLTFRSPGGGTVIGHYNNAGNKVILGYDTGSAWIFQATANVPVMMFKDHYDKVEYAGFSSDDSSAITVTRDGAVYIWDLTTGAQRSAMFSDLLVSYAVPSPDLSKLMVITEGKGILLDVDNQERLWEYVPGNASVNAIAYSPDGRYILIGSSDKRAYLLDVTNGVEVRRFVGHSQAVTAVAFTGDGTNLMTGSTDATVQLWKTDNGKPVGGPPLATISLQGQESQGATVSPNGTRVAMVTGYGGNAQLRMYNDQGLELYAINLTNESHSNWGGTLENITFDKAGERVIVTSRNSEWARNASFRVENGGYLLSWGPQGRFTPWLSTKPKISLDGERIFEATDWGINVLFRTAGKPIYRISDSLGDKGYDISADGSKAVWMTPQNRLRVSSISEGGSTLILDRDAGFNYNSLTMSDAGENVIAGDRMFSAIGGGLLANYAGPDREAQSAFSADGSLWGFIIPQDHSMVTCRTGDPNAVLYNLMLTEPYTPYKMLYHPDNNRVGCVDSNNGVQFYDMSTDLPVGLYRYQYNSDAAISRDGTLLLIGGRNQVRMYEVRTGRILRYFYPQHSGLADVDVRGVQFARNDTMIMIAWSPNYIELYERSMPVGIEINPANRVLSAGDSQAYQVSVIYDDGTRADVTPSSNSQGDLAGLVSDSAGKASVDGNVVTLLPNASGVIRIQARFRDSGRSFTAEAAINVGQTSLVGLIPHPDSMSMIPGVFREIGYTARYADGYEEDVTENVALTSNRPDDVVIAGQSVKVNLTSIPGNIEVTGHYTDAHGQSASAKTIIQAYGLRTQWERYRITAGGYGLSGAWSPDKKKLAWGSSSGGVAFYNTGVTPSQYKLDRILMAHEGQVIFVDYLSPTTLVSVGREGTVKTWDMITGSTVPVSVYSHDAPLRVAARSGGKLALGDAVGKVAVLNLPTFDLDWSKAFHEGPVKSIAVDNAIVISGGEDFRIKILQRSDGTLNRNLLTHTGAIVSVGFMGANVFFSLSEDKTMTLWRRSDYEVLQRYEYPVVPTGAELINNELYVATTNPNATWIYNMDGLLLRWLEHPPAEGGIVKYLIDPSGKFVLTGRATILKDEVNSFDGSVIKKPSPFGSFQFWEVGRGIFRGSLAHSHPLSAAFASPDKKTLFTQDPKRVIRWSYGVKDATAESVNLLETGYFLGQSFAGLDFSGDAQLLATRVGVSVYLFDTFNALLWKTLHTPGPGPFAISPNRQFLASADWKVRLWDLNNLSQINEEARSVAAVDFRGNTNFVGAVQADNFIGVWNAQGKLRIGMQTTHGPIKLYVNSTGTRCAAITLHVECGAFGDCEYYYYLEIFDISNLAIEPPRVGPPVFLLQTKTDLFGGGEGEVNSSVAISDDAGLALVGSEGDRPVRLISTADGSSIREFHPPSGSGTDNIGAGAVAFAEQDKSVLIGWREGYAEMHRRLAPVRIEVLVSRLAGGKSVEKVVINNGTLYVKTGEVLASETLAQYKNGSELNVTSITSLQSTNPSVAQIQGRKIAIPANAPLGGQANVSFSYNDLGTVLETTVKLVVGENQVSRGDTNGDFTLDYLDLIEFSRWWMQNENKSNAGCDKVDDSKIDARDLHYLIKAWLDK